MDLGKGTLHNRDNLSCLEDYKIARLSLYCHWNIPGFEKSFDIVDHRIMIGKLYAYEIRGSIPNWFISYLENRSQYVAFDEAHSLAQPIKCGIPQWLILGPLLFIIYMNDICNVSDVLF